MKVKFVDQQLQLEDDGRTLILQHITPKQVAAFKERLKRCPSARIRKIVSLLLEKVATYQEKELLRAGKVDRYSLIKHYQRLEEDGTPEYYMGWPVLETYRLSAHGASDEQNLLAEHAALQRCKVQMSVSAAVREKVE